MQPRKLEGTKNKYFLFSLRRVFVSSWLHLPRTSNQRSSGSSRPQPRREVFVTDRDTRATRVHVLEAAAQPVVDHRGLLLRDLARGRRPAFDELALQLARIRRQHPIARLASHVVARGGEATLGDVHRVGASRAAESLVVLSLMPIHQLANHFILGLLWRTMRAAVVRQREERRRTGAPPPVRHRANPRVRHNIQTSD